MANDRDEIASDIRTIDLKELPKILGQAAEEEWAQLALLGPKFFRAANGLVRNGWPPKTIFRVRSRIKILPRELQSLISLSSLRILGNAIGDAGAAEIAKLKNLQLLDLVANFIGDAGAAEIAKLENLRSLNLSQNDIAGGGAAEIAKLKNLQSLSLWGNSIGDEGAAEIAKLKNLLSLGLWGNSIGDDGAGEIAKLENLQSLNLSQNNIGCAGAAEIAKLSNLQSLVLSKNNIGAEGAAAIANLKALKSLTLRRNNLGDAGAAEIARLQTLHSLNLRDNNITGAGAAELVKLENLTWLNLSSNKIGDAGAKRFLNALVLAPRRDRMTSLKLRANQITIVPGEVLDSPDAQEILAFWEHVSVGAARPLHEVKVLLLGEGRLGKTHLRRRLFEGDEEFYNPDENSTHNIDLLVAARKWRPDGGESQADTMLRVWDFGGQPNLHASHRFFLADERNLFVVLCSAAQSTLENRLEYWLRMVRHEAGAGVPVVVAITREDLVDLGAKRRLASLDASVLRERTGANVVEVVGGIGWSHAAAALPNGTEVLRRHRAALARLDYAITKAIPSIPGMNNLMPTEFFKLRDWVEAAFEGGAVDRPQKYIARCDFDAKCEALAIPPELRGISLSVLRSLGLLHWVGDRSDVRGVAEIEDLIFNPRWVKGPTYTLIRDGAAMSQAGVLHETMLAGLLREHGGGGQGELWRELTFDAQDRRRVVALMKACQLVFTVLDDAGRATPSILVPDHLEPVHHPYYNESPDEVRYFEYVPEAALLKYIGSVSNDRDFKLLRYARNQIEIESRECNGCRAAVRVEHDARTIQVWTSLGSDEDRRYLRRRVLSDLARLCKGAAEVRMEKEKVEMLAERPLNYDEFLKHRFRVALSFAGEYRGYVEFVAERLVEKLGRNHVFYDAHFEAFANGTRGDIKLMDLYGRAQLVCVFLGRDYAKKEWAGIVEWDAIRDAQKRNAIDTMYFRFDDEDVPGLLSNVIYTDCRKTAKEKVASLILQRIGEQ